ncbi:hypothetical protein JTE90_019500 [Oedothorax gibbosus]|uniref:D-3-phosphoglycerate dehydrogenase n=1 Tax=Oedothorax gibbosus TaxID=931172 RepID=A0AAV6VIM3_9ARAC|nr:hypothetical protein JTE90_019500 [Oedothorax gibbosus]
MSYGHKFNSANLVPNFSHLNVSRMIANNIKSVLISEPTDPICENFLKKHNISVTTKTGLSKEELIEEVKKYDALIVRSATKVNADLINAGRNLKVIARAGVGVDNVDCEAATTQGILVINAPGGNTMSAAELTCVMLAALSRNLAEACASLKAGQWDRKKFMANELYGKTLAIIGLGRIGREVAHRMQAFGMTTIGYDPLVPAEESIKFGVESKSLEEIWPLADYITLHTPLIPQTRNMINNDVFEICRKGVKIVNCARGGIIEETALLSALKSGKCGGAGLDVYLEEPPKCTELLQHPKVICTPHLGASTREAQSRVAEEISQQIVALNEGKSAHGIVNSAAFSLSMVHPQWVKVSKYLGAFASMLFPRTDKDISISANVYGQDLFKKGPLFSTSILIGMLKQRHNVDSNFINTPTLARDAGFEVTKVVTNPLKFDNITLELEATSVSEKHTVLATINNGEPALCNIDGYQFRTLPPLCPDIIIFKGTNHDAVMKVIAILTEFQLANSFSYAYKPEGEVAWIAAITETKVADMPEEVVKELESTITYLDFWAQLKL